MQSELKFRSLDIYCDIQIYPQFSISKLYHHILGGSLIEKIMTHVYFVMQYVSIISGAGMEAPILDKPKFFLLADALYNWTYPPIRMDR